jgi:phosphoribosyl 1,2-cyclic phosphodiesterase
MRVTLFGTRGSIAAPGPETNRYGGNTSAVEVLGKDGTILVLDAGTGIRRLGAQIPPTTTRVDASNSPSHGSHTRPGLLWSSL